MPTTGLRTTSRLSSRFDKSTQLFDTLSIYAEVTPAQARARAHVDHCAVEEELDVVHVAQQLRTELRVQIVLVFPNDSRSRHRSDGLAHRRHAAVNRRDVMLEVARIGLRG